MSSDSPRYTEKDVVLREREAYKTGANAESIRWRGIELTFSDNTFHASELARRYPTPTVERPRVVRDPHAGDYEWSLREGAAMWRGGSHPEWHTPGSVGGERCVITQSRANVIYHLFANPTETVDAD